MSLHLHHFNPADVSPEFMIDREEDLGWLLGTYGSYFDAIEQGRLADSAMQVACLTGDKGMGKSILAMRLIQELRKKYSSSTLFVSVDCRRANGARGLIADIASGLVEEIATFETLAEVGGKPLPAWLGKLAMVLSNIAHADEASVKMVQQQVTTYRAVFKVGGQHMLRALKAEYDISIEREKKDTSILDTTTKFDIDRLVMLTIKLLQDIRTAGLRVFLLVDNVDELQHEYWDDDARKSTLATVKRVLPLAEAPIAMLLCMRTYFKSIFPRAVGERHEIQSLSAAQLLQVVDHRIGLEGEASQRAMRSEEARRVVTELAGRAATPLALINWVKWYTENAKDFADPIEAQADRWRHARYDDFVKQTRAALKLFADKRAEGIEAVSREELIKAVGEDQSAFRYLQTSELILPRDFWDPTHFVLDPSAAWIAGQR